MSMSLWSILFVVVVVGDDGNVFVAAVLVVLQILRLGLSSYEDPQDRIAVGAVR
jgi:hypothetical protein